AVPIDKAALFGCAVLTGVGAVTNAAKVQPGQSVAVFGLGGVGLSAVMGAKLAGASTIIAVDPLPAKLDLARTLGATDTIDLSGANALETISTEVVKPITERIAEKVREALTGNTPATTIDMIIKSFTETADGKVDRMVVDKILDLTAGG